MNKVLGNENCIESYLHCRNCLNKGVRDSVATGFTEVGLQVWCDECNSNIVHIDFEGQSHPANTSRTSKSEKA